LLAVKCVKQTNCDLASLRPLMETFRRMVNDCIRIGLQNNAFTLKQLSKVSYQQLATYNVLSYYKLCAISHAAGILTNRKKSIRRNLKPRQPYAAKSLLVSCYGFKIVNDSLNVPLGNGQYFNIILNSYVRGVLSDPSLKVRSFTLAANNTISICYSKEVLQLEGTNIAGVDRNLCNLTAGNHDRVVQYNLSRAVDIAENTRSIMKSFKRNDFRTRKKIYGKYGKRRRNRINQLLHKVSKAVVQSSKRKNASIAFEDIRHIRRLYKQGNYQDKSSRARLNGWSFAEIKRQIEYKASWEGVRVIQLSVTETRGTSKLCPQCGKKITQVDRRTRQLWCDHCKRWMDRDVVAAINISIRGRSRFERSQGLAGEAVKGNPNKPVILRVDAGKLGLRRQLRT